MMNVLWIAVSGLLGIMLIIGLICLIGLACMMQSASNSAGREAAVYEPQERQTAGSEAAAPAQRRRRRAAQGYQA